MGKKRSRKSSPQPAKRRATAAADPPVAPADPLVLANELRALALPSTTAQSFCVSQCSSGPKSSGCPCGCAKFWLCDIHPEELKKLPIKKIQEDHAEEFEKLKARGCLRAMMDDWPPGLNPRDLVLGDYIGAVGRSAHPAGQAPPRLPWPRCAYYGCVIPEFLGGATGAGTAAAVLEEYCPFARTRRARDHTPCPNPYRFVACKLTRPEVAQLQRRLGVVSISPVVILPGRAIREEVFYLGKNLAAPYQYLLLNPDPQAAEPFLLPQEQPRSHAPRLVRQYLRSPDEPTWRAREAAQTIRSFQLLNKPEKLSNFERIAGVRYIPAGEFVYLMLMWYWSGEFRPTRDNRFPSPLAALRSPKRKQDRERWLRARIDLEAVRDVVLEDAETDLKKTRDGTCLLKELFELGFGADLQQIYGRLKSLDDASDKDHDVLLVPPEYNSFTRRSSRAEDFLRLGLLRCDEGVPELTGRAVELSRWVLAAVESLERPALERLCPLAPHRCRDLLAVDEGDDSRLEFGKALAGELTGAAERGDTAGWLTAIQEFLEGFPQKRKKKLRDILREEAFPIYPLVHLTLLSGISAPLDWVGIPIGGSVYEVPGVHPAQVAPQFKAQGGVFLLSLARPPEEILKLVADIEPLVVNSLLPQLGQWADEVVMRSIRVAEFASIVVAEKHVFAKLLGRLGDLRDLNKREEQLRQVLADPTEFARLARTIGELYVSSSAAVEDGMRFAELAEAGWEWTEDDVPLETLFGQVADVLKPRVAVRYEWAPEEAAAQLVRVSRHAAFHLVLECIRNIVRHDQRGMEAPVRIAVQPLPQDRRVRVSVFNSTKQFEQSIIDGFRDYKVNYDLEALLQKLPDSGLQIMWLLALLTGCGVELDKEHPDYQPRGVGVTRIVFRAPE